MRVCLSAPLSLQLRLPLSLRILTGNTGSRPSKSITPRRKRSTEPTPFVGLTQKPLCARCEQATRETAPLLPVRPNPMPATHRRPYTVDTSKHFCLHTDCDYRGWLGLF